MPLLSPPSLPPRPLLFRSQGFKADAVLHFGMHGTVEWLPGAPLGNTGLSWSDVLLSGLPNVYIYACNNPSESIIAKRRGYGTIVSHNVPPYGRAGLYKQLQQAGGDAEQSSLQFPGMLMLMPSLRRWHTFPIILLPRHTFPIILFFKNVAFLDPPRIYSGWKRPGTCWQSTARTQAPTRASGVPSSTH